MKTNDKYRKSGFFGPDCWYRNIEYNHDITPELEGARFRQPAAFAAGSDRVDVVMPGT